MAANIESQGLILTLVGIFFGGMLVSMTPCVYPMIPITLSIIGARSATSTPLAGFARSLVFVLGIASIYTILGMVVALSGGTVGFLLQNKYFLLSLSVLFIAMGISMLGAYNLQLPPSIAAKLQGNGSRGGYVGAFLLGITTGIVASPCGSPVLVGILALAGAKGQAILGAAMLFTYALGIGMLFLLLGTFPAFLGKVPKSGVWMEDVKKFLGLVLIIASFYYLSLALPTLLVWGMLVATCLIFGLLILFKSKERAGFPRMLNAWRLAALVLFIVAGYVGFNLVPNTLEIERATAERKAVLKLKANAVGTAASAVESADAPPTEWLDDEAAAVDLATKNKWPLVIDFGAEWCAACKELEHKTFNQPEVEKALARFVKVRIDATDETPEVTALQEKYGVVSLPTVTFIDSSGTLQKDHRLLEFEPPAAFIERLAKIQ